MVTVPVKDFLDGAHKNQLEILRDFDRRTVRFFLLNWHRRARKTTLAINILIRECCKNPRRRYGYLTSTYKAAKNIVWRDPNMLKRYLPMELVKKFNESELYVEFINGSILSLHGSDDPDSLRGLDFAGIVIDEWALVKQMVWDEILRPIIAQNKERWAMFIFTPKGINHAHTMWLEANNRDDWKAYLLKASDSGIVPEDELRKAKEEMPGNLYAQEFDCSFLADTDYQVFSTEDLLANINNVERNEPQTRKYTVADVAGEGGDETVIYNMINRKKASQEIYRHKSLMDTVGRIQANARRHGSNLIAVDKIGEGAGVYSRLCEIYEDGSVEVYGYDSRNKARDEKTYANKRAEDHFLLSKELAERYWNLDNDTTLIKQAASINYKYNSTGKIIIEPKEKIKEKISCSPDRIEALIIARDALHRAEPIKAVDRYADRMEDEYAYSDSPMAV